MKINSFGGNKKDLHFSNTTPLPFLSDPHLLSSSTARLCFLSSLPIKPRAKRVAISLIPLLKPILCLHQNLMDSIWATKMKICHAQNVPAMHFGGQSCQSCLHLLHLLPSCLPPSAKLVWHFAAAAPFLGVQPLQPPPPEKIRTPNSFDKEPTIFFDKRG